MSASRRSDARAKRCGCRAPRRSRRARGASSGRWADHSIRPGGPRRQQHRAPERHGDRIGLTRVTFPLVRPHAREAPEDVLPIWTVPADDDLAECCLRLARTAGREREAALLAPILKREMAARLLLGPLGPWIRSALSDAARSSRIADAAARIRSEFEKPLSVAALARSANMSSATFHRHFKAMTGLSPIQYQKAVRLNEARSLIVEESSRISDAAYRVGYASASQFAAGYRHFFGRSPSDDRRRTAAVRSDAPKAKAPQRPPVGISI